MLSLRLPLRSLPARFAASAFVIAVVLTGLTALAGCDREAAPPVTPQESASESLPGSSPDSSRDVLRADEPKIVAFGDSLTAGRGVAPEQTYPAQLQRRLEEAGYRVRVINAGVSGETTAGGLRRVDWVLKSDPGLVILELGGNDGLRGIDPDETRRNLEAIIQRFREASIPLVLAGMKLPPNYGEEFTSRFEAIFPDLARSYQLHYMPFFLEDVALQDGLMQADGIHPTAEGYTVIVDNLMPVIEPALRELSATRS